jgi:hypothetical protein
MRIRWILGCFTAALIGTACTTAGVGSASSGAPSPSAPGGAATGGAPARGWRVATEEHVDLWLHGFALLTSDTGAVPFFARGYKKEIEGIKRGRNIFTNLDANAQQLSQRFATNPSLTNAQFLAMYFPSFQEIVNATDLFIRANGDPRAASDPVMQQELAMLASLFPSPADRDWLRLFVQSLKDENDRFYRIYWGNEQQSRMPAFTEFNELWIGQYYPKLSRFLNNTQQEAGELILSVPLGGEGRTVNNSDRSNVIAVDWPRSQESAPEALYVFAHEAVAKLVQEAVNDNTTPAQQREGTAGGYVGLGAVRGGAVLLQRVLPDLVPGYMRYYLRQRGRPEPSGDPRAAFEAAFPLPEAILTSLAHAIDSVLGGI